MGFVYEKHLKRRHGSTYLYNTESCQQYKDTGSGPVVYGSPINRTSGIQLNRYTGWSIPDFHRRAMRGELLPHTPWRKFTSEGNSTGEYSWTTTGGTSYWYDGNYPAFSDWQLAETDLDALVPWHTYRYVQEAAAKIYSQGFDALTFIAELKDLRRQFADLAKKLRHVKLPKNWKGASSEWLSIRYGWRPLIYDLIGIDKAIKNLNDKRTRYSERAGYNNSVTYYNTREQSWANWTNIISVQDEITVRERGSVVADIEVPAFQFNPLQTGWEIIPFSFVVDWFVSVGKSLSAVSFLTTQSKYSASIGHRIEVKRTMEVESYDYSAVVASGGFTQSGSCEASLEVRVPCRVPIHPFPALRLDSLKILDLVGLVAQRLKTRRN